MKAFMNTDGGARGNPGPGGIGVVIYDEADEVIGEVSRAIGHTTNNIAEYEAVIAGLELAKELGVTDIEIRADSKLVVNQLNGEWKIKSDKLRSLAVNARRLMNAFPNARITHVRREQNSGADALANQAMDAAELMDEPGGRESLF
jgi:ribonuclease HI